MIYVGIDPGLSGGIAVLGEDGGYLFGSTTPVIKASGSKTQYDMPGMLGLLERAAVGGRVLVTIEDVMAMPHDGVVSSFRFGLGYGIWLGLISGLQLSLQRVRPVAWQKPMLAGLPRGKSTKVSAVARAKDLWPTIEIRRKADHGLADAALIAEWGRRNHRGEKDA